MNILYFYPGQQVTIITEIKDNDGNRVDPLILPVVNKIIKPDLTEFENYPQNMIKINTGIYYFKFNLPSGAISIGSYLTDIQYTHPTTNILNNKLYQIIVLAPFGNFTASVGI